MPKVIISVLISVLAVSKLAAADCSLKCPDGYLTFDRTPTDANSQTSTWCVKTIFPSDPINITTAKTLCAAESAVVTTFENDNERNQVIFALQQVISAAKQSSGSIILDGHRIPQCDTQDKTVLRADPCNDATKAFTVDDKHTDPTFMYQNWADTEPSATGYEQSVESCIALGISVYPKRNGKINDYLCDYAKSPYNTATVEFWNFGVLCGRLPEFR